MDKKLEFLTKELVEQAAIIIDKEGVPGRRKAKDYEVEINDKFYPFKLLVTEAAKIKGIELKSGDFESNEANRIGFEKLTGFDCIKKENKGDQKIMNLIDKYKILIRKNRLDEEIYKWHFAKLFHGKPDVSVNDFSSEIRSIDFRNLIYGVGISVTHHIADAKPEEFRSAFKVLLDGTRDLQERISYFTETTLKVYRELVPDVKLSHHQDERTMATYLAYYNANKYPFFMDSFYQKYCRLIDVKPKQKNYKYVHYVSLINELIQDYIIPDKELLDLKSEILDEDCFEDKNHYILAQDFLFQMLEKNRGFDRKYWRIGTTEEGVSRWPTMLNSNHVSIGWSDLGDFDQLNINNRNDILKRFKKIGYYKNDKQTASRKGGEILNFYNDVNVRDVVVAQDGQSVVGIGIVSEGYHFDEAFPFAHFKPTEWKIKEPPGLINKKGPRTTVYPITDHNFIYQIEALLKEEITMEYKDDEPLNQILFGPPGTGKTYHTINKALEIIGENIDDKCRKDIKELFNQRINEGQIVFTTFHQSMTYEDFVEGIKPQEPDKPGDPISFITEPGIFRKICNKAQIKKENNFEGAYNSLVEEIKGLKKEDEEGDTILELKTKTGKVFGVSVNRNKNLNLHTGPKKIKQGVLTKDNIQNQLAGIDKFDGWDGYFNAVIKHLKDKHSFVEKPTKNPKKYVLIIDEINRGNVSQILGELITLIEEDKRIGKPEELQLTLPYTKDKEKFGVPSNLYIIGTMNTADRSVEALDTALRRRFSFVEMAPESILCSPGQMLLEFLWENEDFAWENEKFIAKENRITDLLEIGDDYNKAKYDIWDTMEKEGKNQSQVAALEKQITFNFSLQSVLEAINMRIEKLCDKDHLIGHSYFMKVRSMNELKTVFYNKVIPLLQEYFYGDFGKIGLVLGNGFVREYTNNENIFADFNYDSQGLAERKMYEIIDYRKPGDKFLDPEKEETKLDFRKAINILLNNIES